MISMEKSRGLCEIREPNLVWRFGKSSLRKWHFRWDLWGLDSEEMGEGPILGRGDTVLKKLAEGQGGWSVVSQGGQRDE